MQKTMIFGYSSHHPKILNTTIGTMTAKIQAATKTIFGCLPRNAAANSQPPMSNMSSGAAMAVRINAARWFTFALLLANDTNCTRGTQGPNRDRSTCNSCCASISPAPTGLGAAKPYPISARSFERTRLKSFRAKPLFPRTFRKCTRPGPSARFPASPCPRFPASPCPRS